LGNNSRATPALMSALTHVHVGAGRSPGTVDLPIIRDPFGVPFIPGSSIKGALKTTLSIENGCVIESGSNAGRTDCSKCSDICCFLGPEEGAQGASKLVITDFYPLLVPVPSLEEGFAYVTFPRLVRYAESLVSGSGGLVNKLVNTLSEMVKGEEGVESKDPITVGVEKYPVIRKHTLSYADVHPFLKNVNVYALEDKYAKFIFDRVTVKVTRVRIDRNTKTVATGALWTEEYLPHGTILVGAFVERNWYNEYCGKISNNNWKAVLKFSTTQGNGTRIRELVLGGKETIGKGLVRIIIQ